MLKATAYKLTANFMNQDIINYIKEARAHGLQDLEIKQNLLTAGWEARDVEDNFTHTKALENQLPSNRDEDITASGAKPPAEQPLSQPELKESTPNTSVPIQTYAQAGAAGQATGKSRKIIWIAVGILLFLAAGSAAGYYYWTHSPGKIWQAFRLLNQKTAVSGSFKFAYADSGQADGDALGLNFDNMRLELSGNTYSDQTDPKNLKLSSQISYTFQNGGPASGSDFEYRIINNRLYLKPGSSALFQNLFKTQAGTSSPEWLVMDLGAGYGQALGNQGSGGQIAEIWKDANVFKMDKYLGKKQLDGKTVLGFSVSIDARAFKQALEQTLNLSAQGLAGQESLSSVTEAVSALGEKLKVEQSEIWVGQKDLKLYGVKIKSNAPSVASIVKNLLTSYQGQAGDAKRLADVQQISMALELYKGENGKYPVGENGVAVGLTPKYMGEFPVSPMPAGGACTDYFNSYWYQQKNNGTSYEMTFCLGNATAGYQAGIGKLTPAGIEANIQCPSTPENCVNIDFEQNPAPAPATFNEALDKIDFSAGLEFELDYSGYGEQKAVEEPQGAVDWMQMLIPRDPGLETPPQT